MQAAVVFALVAVVRCGAPATYIHNPTIGSQSELTLRGVNGHATVSKQAKVSILF